MHGAGKFGLASLCNLDQLPPTGAVVIAAPLKIVHGSGSPVRVLAITRVRAVLRIADCGLRIELRIPVDLIHNQIRNPKSAIRITSSLKIVSSRSEPVETIAARTPDTSSSRAMYLRAASGS